MIHHVTVTLCDVIYREEMLKLGHLVLAVEQVAMQTRVQATPNPDCRSWKAQLSQSLCFCLLTLQLQIFCQSVLFLSILAASGVSLRSEVWKGNAYVHLTETILESLYVQCHAIKISHNLQNHVCDTIRWCVLMAHFWHRHMRKVVSAPDCRMDVSWSLRAKLKMIHRSFRLELWSRRRIPPLETLWGLHYQPKAVAALLRTKTVVWACQVVELAETHRVFSFEWLTDNW